jgi:GT2 family glycosyltransferase
MKIDLVIVIVCYNSQDIIVQAINSIKEDSLNVKIIILDNCSTDRTIDVISNLNDGRVILIESEKNIGFAGGCNYIFDFVTKNKLSCDYFLMFNPDAISETNCLFRLIETFSIDSRIGIVSPRITFLNGKIWYTGAMINWKKLKINNNPSNPEDINIRETDVFSGCAAIIKADVLKKNGYSQIPQMACSNSINIDDEFKL